MIVLREEHRNTESDVACAGNCYFVRFHDLDVIRITYL